MNLSQHIAARAREDEAFRKALLSNPKEAIEQAFDVELSGGITIHAQDPEAGAGQFVSPPNPEEELSAEQLEGVAGGTGGQRPTGTRLSGGSFGTDSFFDVWIEAGDRPGTLQLERARGGPGPLRRTGRD